MKLLLMVSFYYAVANSRALNKNCSSIIDPNEDFLLVNDSYYDTYTLEAKQSTTEAIFNNREIHLLHDEEYSGDYDPFEAESRDRGYSGNFEESRATTHQDMEYSGDYVLTKMDDEDLLPDMHLTSNQAIFNNLEIHVFQNEEHSGDYDHLGRMSDKDDESRIKSHLNKEYSGDNDQLETESRDGESSGNYEKSRTMTHQHKEYSGDYDSTKIDDEDLPPDMHLTYNQAIFNNLEIHVFQDEEHSGDYDQLEMESRVGGYSGNYKESRMTTHQDVEYSGDHDSTKMDDKDLFPDMHLISNQAIFNNLEIYVFQAEEHSGVYDQLGRMSDKNDESGIKSHQNKEYSGDNDQLETDSRDGEYSGNYEKSGTMTHQYKEYSGDYDSTKIDDEDLPPEIHLTSNQATFNHLEIHVFQDEEHSGDYDQFWTMSDKNDESGMESHQNKEYSGDNDQLESESRDSEYSGNYEKSGTITHQHKKYSGDYDSTKIDDEDLPPDTHLISSQAIFNNLEIHVFQDEEHSGDYDQLWTMSDKNDESGKKSHQNKEYSGDNDQLKTESRDREYSGNYEKSGTMTHQHKEYSGDYDPTKIDDEDLLPDTHLTSNQAIFNNQEIHVFQVEEHSGDYDQLGTMFDKNDESGMKSHQNKEYSGDNDQLETDSRDGEYSGNYEKSWTMTHQYKEYSEDYDSTKIDDEDLPPETHLTSNQDSTKPPEKNSSLSHQEDKHVEHRGERKKGGGG